MKSATRIIKVLSGIFFFISVLDLMYLLSISSEPISLATLISTAIFAVFLALIGLAIIADKKTFILVMLILINVDNILNFVFYYYGYFVRIFDFLEVYHVIAVACFIWLIIYSIILKQKKQKKALPIAMIIFSTIWLSFIILLIAEGSEISLFCDLSISLGFLLFSIKLLLDCQSVKKESKDVSLNNHLTTADILLNYKKLLDDGDITREEFENKKKALLKQSMEKISAKRVSLIVLFSIMLIAFFFEISYIGVYFYNSYIKDDVETTTISNVEETTKTEQVNTAIENVTAASDESTTIVLVEEKIYYVKTMGGKLNVRSGPGTSYEKIGQLKNGTAIITISSENNWMKIRYGNTIGWVSAEYLSETVPDMLTMDSDVTKKSEEIGTLSSGAKNNNANDTYVDFLDGTKWTSHEKDYFVFNLTFSNGIVKQIVDVEKTATEYYNYLRDSGKAETIKQYARISGTTELDVCKMLIKESCPTPVFDNKYKFIGSNTILLDDGTKGTVEIINGKLYMFLREYEPVS